MRSNIKNKYVPRGLEKGYIVMPSKTIKAGYALAGEPTMGILAGDS